MLIFLGDIIKLSRLFVILSVAPQRCCRNQSQRLPSGPREGQHCHNVHELRLCQHGDCNGEGQQCGSMVAWDGFGMNRPLRRVCRYPVMGSLHLDEGSNEDSHIVKSNIGVLKPRLELLKAR
jgi:hypothetical protein